jgi:hypothetical protein
VPNLSIILIGELQGLGKNIFKYIVAINEFYYQLKLIYLFEGYLFLKPDENEAAQIIKRKLGYATNFTVTCIVTVILNRG